MILSIFISFHPTATYHGSLFLSQPASEYWLFRANDMGDTLYGGGKLPPSLPLDILDYAGTSNAQCFWILWSHHNHQLR